MHLYILYFQTIVRKWSIPTHPQSINVELLRAIKLPSCTCCLKSDFIHVSKQQTDTSISPSSKKVYLPHHSIIRWGQWKVRSVRCSSSPSLLVPFSWHRCSFAIFAFSDNCAAWAMPRRPKDEVDGVAANDRLLMQERIVFCWVNWRT